MFDLTLFVLRRHVHGFLQQIGEGIQHVASRVENLVAFVQNCTEMREATGEVRIIENRYHEQVV